MIDGGCRGATMNDAADERDRNHDERCLWRAVSVQACAGACPAARRLGGARFLVAQAPTLPLDECDLPDDCECVFRHHADRRVGAPRRTASAGDPRALAGRRATDR
jgi:hypothetical protein